MKKVVILFLFLLLIPCVFAGELKVTQEHPFLINNEWIPAKQLVVGDLLTTIEGKARIISIEEIENSSVVYNIHVNGYNDYYAEGVLVHNKAKKYAPSISPMRGFSKEWGTEADAGIIPPRESLYPELFNQEGYPIKKVEDIYKRIEYFLKDSSRWAEPHKGSVLEGPIGTIDEFITSISDNPHEMNRLLSIFNRDRRLCQLLDSTPIVTKTWEDEFASAISSLLKEGYLMPGEDALVFTGLIDEFARRGISLKQPYKIVFQWQGKPINAVEIRFDIFADFDTIVYDVFPNGENGYGAIKPEFRPLISRVVDGKKAINMLQRYLNIIKMKPNYFNGEMRQTSDVPHIHIGFIGPKGRNFEFVILARDPNTLPQ